MTEDIKQIQINKSKPNQGYIFGGTTSSLFEEHLALGDNGEIIYTGNRFIPELHVAISYSHKHTNSSISVPCVICVDAKYVLENPIITELCLGKELSKKLNGTTYPEIGQVPLSELKIFKTDRVSGIEKLVGLAKTNPNPKLKELIEESFGNDWENYKRMLVEEIKKKEEKCH